MTNDQKVSFKKGDTSCCKSGTVAVEICWNLPSVWIKALSTPFFLMVLKYLRINHEPGSRRQNRHGLQYLTFSSYNQSAISQNYSSQKEENKYSKSYKISSCNPYLPPSYLPGPSRRTRRCAQRCDPIPPHLSGSRRRSGSARFPPAIEAEQVAGLRPRVEKLWNDKM